MGNAVKEFKFLAGLILLPIGGFLFVIGITAIAWSSFLASLSLPIISNYGGVGIAVGFVELVISAIMVVYGIRMVNDGASTFGRATSVAKKIVFALFGVSLCAVGIVVSLASGGAGAIVGVPIFFAGLASVDYAFGAKVARSQEPVKKGYEMMEMI